MTLTVEVERLNIPLISRSLPTQAKWDQMQRKLRYITHRLDDAVLNRDKHGHWWLCFDVATDNTVQQAEDKAIAILHHYIGRRDIVRPGRWKLPGPITGVIVLDPTNSGLKRA